MQQVYFKHPRRLTNSLAALALAIASLSTAPFAMAAPQDATAATLIRGPQGDVMQLRASSADRMRLNSAANPFADAKRRAAVLPMIWNEEAKPDRTPEKTLRYLPPAQNSGDGRPLSFSNYMARNDFPEAWRAIDAEAAKLPPAGKTRDDLRQPMDGAH